MAAQSGIQTRLQSQGGPKSIIDLVIQEHRLQEQLYDQFQKSRDLKEKELCMYRMIKEISEHGAKEEMVMYPVMKKKLPDGVTLVQRALAEHLQVKQELFIIDQMALGVHPELEQRLHKLMSDVMQHVKEEERELLPSLQKVLSEGELLDLGMHYTMAAAKAPSRPHPDAPQEGPMAEAINIQAKTEDALRDTARGLEKTPAILSGQKPASYENELKRGDLHGGLDKAAYEQTGVPGSNVQAMRQ